MKHLTMILIFLMQGACASKFYIPGNRFLSPENSGKFMHADIKTGGVGVTSVQTADDITKTTPDTTPVLKKNSAPMFAMQMGLIPMIDVYYTDVSGGPGFAGGKIQLIGDNFREAKEGNFSFTLAGGTAFGDQSNSAEVAGLKSEAKKNFKGYEAMVIMGYRPADWVLFYLSPFVTHIEAKDTIQRTDTTIVGATPSLISQTEGAGDMKGGTVGLRIGKYFFVNGEVSVTETSWKQKKPTVIEATKFKNTAIGVAIGGAW